MKINSLKTKQVNCIWVDISVCKIKRITHKNVENKKLYLLILKWFCINISSVVEFQRLWVLKSKVFGQESTCIQRKIFKKILQVMTVCQKVTKSYFQSQFWISKIIEFFQKKFYLRISI